MPASSGLSGGAIGGIVTGVAVVVIVAIIALVVYKLKIRSMALARLDAQSLEMQSDSPSANLKPYPRNSQGDALNGEVSQH